MKSSKGRYVQQCANHKNRTKNLRYIYNGGPDGTDPRAGQLLCESCRKKKDV